MIKEYVCSKLNQYLSTYIEEIDENDLLLSLYDGKVQLHNVRLSKSFLEDSNFSIKVEEIRIGELSLTIPWLSLSSSVQVIIDNISVVLSDEKTDSINSHDDNVVIENDLSMEHPTLTSSIPDSASILQFLTMTCNRVDVSIRNLHIRLINERSSLSSSYCAAGAFIKELSVTATKEESALIHYAHSDYLHKSLVVKGLSIYCDTNNSQDNSFDESLHVMDGLNGNLELAYDIQKNRVCSYDHVIHLTHTILTKHQQSSLLKCLQENSVLSNTSHLHSVDDLRLFLESHLLDDFGDERLKEVAEVIYPSIKYQTPLLTVTGYIESCHSTLQSSSLQYLNNVINCFADKTTPLSISPVVNTNSGSLTPRSIALYLVTRIFSSYSSILLALMTLICFPFWLYYSFASVIGGLITLGTGLLYYNRLFGQTQEERVPELDEEREFNSTLCSVNIMLKSLSGQVMNDDRQTIFEGEVKNVHLEVDTSHHETKGNIEIQTLTSCDLHSHITPFCSIQFCRSDLWMWTGHCSSLSLNPSLLYHIWNEFCNLSSTTSTNSSLQLGMDHNSLSFPEVLLELEELSVVHQLSSTSLTIQSVQIREKFTGILLLASSSLQPQFSLHYQPSVPLEIHCSEIHGELTLSHLLSFYNYLTSLSTSSSALLYKITIDHASLHLPLNYYASGSSVTIECVTPSESMQCIEWSCKEITLEELIPSHYRFVCMHSSEAHGYYKYSGLISRFSCETDTADICLHKSSIHSLSQCFDILYNIWNDFWYCMSVSLNSSSTEELSEVSDSDLLSSFILDIAASSVRCLLVDSPSQSSEQPSCFYDEMKATASMEGEWTAFSFFYHTTPASQEMIITANTCSILYPLHDPHPSGVRIDMSDVPGVYYHDTQKGLFRETKLDVGVSHIVYASSLMALPAMIQAFVSDSPITTAAPFTGNSIIQSTMTHSCSLSIRELEIARDPFTVILEGYGAIEWKGPQVESWTMKLTRLEINDWLSIVGQCEMVDKSLRIETSSITLSLNPMLLSFLLNSFCSLPSSSSSPSSIIPSSSAFSVTIPSAQLFLLSDQVPIMMLTAEYIHTKGHYNHEELSLHGEMTLECDYYKNEVNQWEEVLHSWRVSGYYEKKNKSNTLTLDSFQVINFTITKPFLSVAVPFVRQLSEAISTKPSVASIQFTKNDSCICFVNHSGMDLSIDLLSGQQYDTTKAVETFTLTKGSSYVSQQLAFPAFSSRLSTETSLPSHLYARVNGPSFPSLKMELYGDDISVVGNTTGDHLLAHSHVHDGQKEVVFSGRISLVNHSPIPLFYSIDATGEGQLQGVTEPLVLLPVNDELFLPISAVDAVLSLCTEERVKRIECSAITRLSLHTVVSSLNDTVVQMGRNRCCFTLHRSIHQVAYQSGCLDRIRIEIVPCLSVVNLLPISIPVMLVDDLREYEKIQVGSGQTAYILRAPASLSKCRIQVQLDEKGECKETHCLNEPLTGLLRFDNSCIRYQFDETQNVVKTVILSADYCVMNETESSIVVNYIGENEQYYCSPFCTPSRPLFLSFNPQDHHIHSIRIRADGYRWSGNLSVDGVNTDSCIEMLSAKGLDSQFLLMTVAFIPESLSNSKMILFSSGYSIFNTTTHILAVCQTDSYGSPLIIQPGDTVEFHWNEYSSNRTMQIQDKTQHSLWSDSFTVSYNEQFVTLLFDEDRSVSSNTEPSISVRCDLSHYRHTIILSFPEADPGSQSDSLDQVINSYNISLSLAGVGISLVEEMELSFLSFSALMVQFYKGESGDICVYSEINGIQIDSSLVNAHFPVVLGSNQQAVPLSDKTLLSGETSVHSLNLEPAFQLSLQCHSSPSLLIISSCEFILSPTLVNMESQFLFTLIEFLSPFFTSKSVIQSFFNHPTSADTNPRLVLIQSLLISPIQFKLSLHSSSQLPFTQTIYHHHRIPSLLRALFDATGRILVNVNNAPICLKSLSYENSYTTLSTLIYQLRDYYIQEMSAELYKLVGSANILGNPSELVTSVEEGVQSFIDESKKGLKKGPKGVVTGIGKGALGLLSKTAYGILNSAEHITDTLGDSMESFNILDHSRTERTSGKSGLLHGVKAGVEGFVDTLKSGSIEDVGKGVVGMITKPIGGLIEDTSILIGKAKDITNEEMKLERIRLPRFICPGPVVMEYCNYLVNGAWFVHDLLNSNNGSYFCHLPVNNNTMLLIFTTKQLVIIDMHSHSLLWSCCYSSIHTQLKKQYLILRNDHQVVTCFVHRQLFIYLIQYYLILFAKTMPNDCIPSVYSFVNRLLTGLESYPYIEDCHYAFTKKQLLRWILIESVTLAEIDDCNNTVTWNVRGCSYQWICILNESDMRLLHNVIFALPDRPVGLTRTIREGEQLKIVIKEIEGVLANYPYLLVTEEVDGFFKKNCHHYCKCAV